MYTGHFCHRNPRTRDSNNECLENRFSKKLRSARNLLETRRLTTQNRSRVSICVTQKRWPGHEMLCENFPHTWFDHRAKCGCCFSYRVHVIIVIVTYKQHSLKNSDALQAYVIQCCGTGVPSGVVQKLPSTVTKDAGRLVGCSKCLDRKQQSSCDRRLWLSVAHSVCRRQPTSIIRAVTSYARGVQL